MKGIETVSAPEFQVVGVGQGCWAINDRGQTIATISSQGNIDWLLRSPLQAGSLLTSIRKETHLSYVLGLKIQLTTPRPETVLKALKHRFQEGGRRLILEAQSESADGKFIADTRAELYLEKRGARYEWEFETVLTCVSSEPVELGWLEFNNIYPGKAGRDMLSTSQKEYDCTLLSDREGRLWKFPHQHLMHYSPKIGALRFAEGTMGGFFAEQAESPVVIIQRSSVEPDWAICDMYYDLHCAARLSRPVQPGQTLAFGYLVKHLDVDESKKCLEAAVSIPVNASDRAVHDYPRLELGMNHFDQSVRIDQLDDASGFRTAPPQKVWDKDIGFSRQGSLRITNEMAKETVWTAEPVSQIPPQTALHVTGMAKAVGVEGKGLFIRIRYQTFVWHPTPHVDVIRTLESVPTVTGTTPGWVKIEVPELRVPEEHFDYLVCMEVVLDGKGTAWLTNLEIDLQATTRTSPLGKQVRTSTPSTYHDCKVVRTD